MASILGSTKSSLQDKSFFQILGDRLLPQDLKQFESNLEALIKLSVIDVSTDDKIRAAKLRQVHFDGHPSDFTFDDEPLEHSVSQPSSSNNGIGLQLHIDQPKESFFSSKSSSDPAPALSSKRKAFREGFKGFIKSLL
jgi:hypothetical protein